MSTAPAPRRPPGLAALALPAIAAAALGALAGLALARPAAGRAADSALHASPHVRHRVGHHLVRLRQATGPALLRWKAVRVPRVHRPAPRVIQLPPRVVTVVSRRIVTAPAAPPPSHHGEHEHEREHEGRGGGDD